MTLYQFLLALRARFGVFALAVAVTVLAALAASLYMSKVYIASAALLVDAREQQTLDSQGGPSARYQSGYLQTQVDIIQSRSVADRVIDDLKLLDRPAMQATYEKESDGKLPMRQWLNGWLRERLIADTSQSSVLSVGFRAKRDPELAAEMANAFANAYMKASLDLRVTPMREAAAWFDEQLKELRVSLERAQEKLLTAQNERGLLGIDGMDDEQLRYQELQRQLREAEGNLSTVNPEAIAMRLEVARAESKLREISTQLGPRHPSYQRAQAEVQSLRGRLADTSSTTGGRGRIEQLRKELAAQRERVMKNRLGRSDLAVLQREVESAQRAYDGALQRFVVSKVDSTARQTNVSLLSAAVPPTQAARPKPLLNALLAAIAGSALGLALVYLLEILDRRVRGRDDLEQAVRTPVLLVLEDRPSAFARLPMLPGPARAALAYRR